MSDGLSGRQPPKRPRPEDPSSGNEPPSKKSKTTSREAVQLRLKIQRVKDPEFFVWIQSDDQVVALKKAIYEFEEQEKKTQEPENKTQEEPAPSPAPSAAAPAPNTAPTELRAYRLIYKGRVLADKKSLDFYSIRHEDTVQLVPPRKKATESNAGASSSLPNPPSATTRAPRRQQTTPVLLSVYHTRRPPLLQTGGGSGGRPQRQRDQPLTPAQRRAQLPQMLKDYRQQVTNLLPLITQAEAALNMGAGNEAAANGILFSPLGALQRSTLSLGRCLNALPSSRDTRSIVRQQDPSRRQTTRLQLPPFPRDLFGLGLFGGPPQAQVRPPGQGGTQPANPNPTTNNHPNTVPAQPTSMGHRISTRGFPTAPVQPVPAVRLPANTTGRQEPARAVPSRPMGPPPGAAAFLNSLFRAGSAVNFGQPPGQQPVGSHQGGPGGQGTTTRVRSNHHFMFARLGPVARMQMPIQGGAPPVGARQRPQMAPSNGVAQQQVAPQGPAVASGPLPGQVRIQLRGPVVQPPQQQPLRAPRHGFPQGPPGMQTVLLTPQPGPQGIQPPPGIGPPPGIAQPHDPMAPAAAAPAAPNTVEYTEEETCVIS